MTERAMPQMPLDTAPREAIRLIDLDSVRTRRIFAFCIDLAVLIALISLASVVVAVFGIVTFGLGWLLFGILVPACAVLYFGLTAGGPRAATPGMRFCGIRLCRMSGGAPDFLFAAGHVVLFYISVAVLTPFVLLFTFLNKDKRLLHDILIGAVVLRGPST